MDTPTLDQRSGDAEIDRLRAELAHAATRLEHAEDALRRNERHLSEELQLVRNEFRLAIDHIPGLVWSSLPDGFIDFLNLRWLQYAGMSHEQACGWGWQAALHPDDLPALLRVWKGLLASCSAGETEARLRRHDGVYRWFLFRASPLYDEDGTLIKWYGQTTDVDDLKRAEALLAGEKRLLEMITKGSALAATFDTMCRMVDAIAPESLAAVTLLDARSGRLSLAAAPNLPPDIVAAFNSAQPADCPCAVAAASGKPLIVADLAAESCWPGFRALAARHGLRACYATPITASDGTVLGTFTLHARLAGPPSTQQRRIIDQFSHLAAVAIERSCIDTALQDSEERFRRMAETTSDLIRITDLAPLRVLYANPSFERVWGRSLEQLYREPQLLTEAVHPDDLAALHASFARAAAGHDHGRYDIEFRLLLPDGAVRWIHERGVFVFDEFGRALQQSSISTDITERKAGEAALRESQERFALATAATTDGIWDLDVPSDTMFISERAQRIFGLEPGPTERPCAEWNALITLYHEGAALPLGSVWEDCQAGVAPVLDGEWRVHGLDGALRWVRIRALCVRDGGGQPMRLAGSVSDIDAQRRTEAALAQAHRLEAMGTLAGGIAHDFNNILGAILGYGEMALRGAAKGSRLRRDLQSIVIAGERGRSLVERILAFSRSGASERVAVHVEQVVGEALKLLRATLPANIQLEVRLNAGRAAMLGGATQVHQVVMNLASNAVQAMPAGGTVRVSLRALTLDAPRIATTGQLAPGDYLELQVSDTGCGVDPAILDRIFDPFFTTKEVGVGTGLGLSLVHGIVLDVGGAVDVATALGQGSTFTVYLPRAGEAAAPCERAAAPLARGAGQRILVVDDEEPLVQLAFDTLSELGYQPIGFTSSSAALAAFSAAPGQFDAVLTDERMPGMSGSALIVHLRALRPGLPVMLMSGYLGEPAAGARDSLADEILRKPLGMADLAGALARVLSRPA